MPVLTSYRFETISIIFSSLGILVSLFFEFVIGNQPCKLCLWQRYLLLSILCLSTLSLITSFKAIVLLILGVFVALIGVSGYHAMIQFGLAHDPCSVPVISSKKEFWEAINSPIPCSKISASIFGMPLSLLGSVSSFVTVFFLVRELLKKPTGKNHVFTSHK